MTELSLFDRLWERHRNPISWILRPILGIIWFYAAWVQNLPVVLICIFSLATSWFWFPKPESSPDWVMRFLEIEKEYVTPPWTYKKVIPFSLMVISLGLFTWVMWYQDWRLGMAILIFGFLFKGVWSYVNARDAGLPITILSLVAILALVIVVYVILL